MPADLLPILYRIKTLLQGIPVDIGPDALMIQALLWLDDVRARLGKMGEAPAVPTDPADETVARLWAEPDNA